MPDHDAGATVCRWVLVLLGGLMLLQALVQLAGANFKAHLRPEDLPMPTGIWRTMLQGNGRETMLELRCQRPSGEVVHVALHNGQFSERQASAPCLILQAQDISARREAETQLQHIAYHDSLTSLANRLRQQVRPINTVGGDESVATMQAAAMRRVGWRALRRRPRQCCQASAAIQVCTGARCWHSSRRAIGRAPSNRCRAVRFARAQRHAAISRFHLLKRFVTIIRST